MNFPTIAVLTVVLSVVALIVWRACVNKKKGRSSCSCGGCSSSCTGCSRKTDK